MAGGSLDRRADDTPGEEVPGPATYPKVWKEGHRPPPHPATRTTTAPPGCPKPPSQDAVSLGEAPSPLPPKGKI